MDSPKMIRHDHIPAILDRISRSGNWHIKGNDRGEIVEIDGHPLERVDEDNNE